MKSFIEAVKAAEAATGTGSRAIKQQAVESLSDIGRKLVCEALSPYIVYGVKKFSVPKVYADTDAGVEEILMLLSALSSRAVTGNSAKDAIEKTLAKYTKDTADILVRIIKKDLKWGLSAETVNEVLLGEKRPAVPIVPVYACALAEKYDKKKFKWKFPALLEAKYDGQRNQAFYESNECVHRLFHKARSGKDSNHLDDLFDADFEALNKSLNELTQNAFVLDGEVMGATWNDTMSAKGSDNQDKKDLLNLYAYDIIPRNEWNTERCSMTQFERTVLLDTAIAHAREHHGLTRIFKSKWRIVNSVEEAEAFYAECLEEGFEGAMIKDPDALYSWKRSTAWTKWKPVQTYDGRIVDFYNGKEGSKLEHTLGGVTIEGVDENGVKFRCNVGSGFPLDTRDEIFNNKEAFRGKMTEIEASPDLNIEDDRDFQTLKWGVWKKMRPDKD